MIGAIGVVAGPAELIATPWSLYLGGSVDELLRDADEAGVEDPRLRSGGPSSDARVDGTSGGRPVSLFRERRGDAVLYRVEAPIEPPLDLGVEMRPGSLARQPTSFGIEHLHLDQEYALTVDELGRARALFDAAFADRVYALHCSCVSPAIDDARVQIVGDWSRASVAGVVEMVELVEAARGRIPPPAPLAPHVPPWTALAARIGTELLHTPLRVLGSYDQLALLASATRTGRARHRLHLKLRVQQPLGAGLRLTPTRALVDTIGVLFGGQDVRVGEPSFDDAFRIRVAAAHEETLTRALDQGTRALLLGARERGAELTLDDDGLEATFAADADIEALPSAVEPLAEATRRIERALRLGDRIASPYRA